MILLNEVAGVEARPIRKVTGEYGLRAFYRRADSHRACWARAVVGG